MPRPSGSRRETRSKRKTRQNEQGKEPRQRQETAHRFDENSKFHKIRKILSKYSPQAIELLLKNEAERVAFYQSQGISREEIGPVEGILLAKRRIFTSIGQLGSNLTLELAANAEKMAAFLREKNIVFVLDQIQAMELLEKKAQKIYGKAKIQRITMMRRRLERIVLVRGKKK